MLILLFAVLVVLLIARWMLTPKTEDILNQDALPESLQSPVYTDEELIHPEVPSEEASDEADRVEERPAASDQGIPAVSEKKAEHRYTEETYRIVTDLVHICREEGLKDDTGTISALLEELQTADPELGRFWRRTVDYLAYTDGELAINRSSVPEDLPEDDSLCIIVLGFQLLYDGEMAPELLGRCELALEAAQRYPNAWIAVTGGGTAAGNRAATEADVMAEWLISRGIAPERIIIENSSLTTDQNAVNTCAILTEEIPQVRQLMIVTSDYHVPLGCMMFSEAAYLYSMETENPIPFSVSANYAYATSGNAEYTGVKNLLSYIWVMADPSY